MAANRQSKGTDIDLGGDDRPMPADIELVIDSAGAAATMRDEGPELALNCSPPYLGIFRRSEVNRTHSRRQGIDATDPNRTAAR